jgi:hypothetical protein
MLGNFSAFLCRNWQIRASSKQTIVTLWQRIKKKLHKSYNTASSVHWLHDLLCRVHCWLTSSQVALIVHCQGAHNWQPTARRFRKAEQTLDSWRKHLPLSWTIHRLLHTVVMTDPEWKFSNRYCAILNPLAGNTWTNKQPKNRWSQFIHVNRDCKKVAKMFYHPPHLWFLWKIQNCVTSHEALAWVMTGIELLINVTQNVT